LQKHKRQFRGTSKPKTTYDRKVRPAGFTRYVAMGKVIPEDWQYVRLTLLNRTPTSIEILIERLLGRKNHAQTKTNHTTNQQNT